MSEVELNGVQWSTFERCGVAWSREHIAEYEHYSIGGTVQYRMVWMVWYDTIRYGIVWQGMNDMVW